MPQPWEATFSPTLDEVMGVLQDECALDVTSLESFGSGWDNDAYLVNKQYVFRFPRREMALDLLNREMIGLPYARMADLLIPVIEYQAKKSKYTGRPFVGYRLIEGEAAGHLSLDDAEKRKLGRQLAVGLKDLHTRVLPPDVQNYLEEGNDWRINMASRARTTSERVIKNASLFPKAGQIALRMASYGGLPVPPERCLLHGDIYPLHLLVKDGNLNGVIDWGDIHWGAPGQDLAIFFGYFPPESVEDLVNLYGPLSKETMRFSAWRAAWHATALIPFCAEKGLSNLLQESHIALTRAFEWLNRLG